MGCSGFRISLGGLALLATLAGCPDPRNEPVSDASVQIATDGRAPMRPSGGGDGPAPDPALPSCPSGQHACAGRGCVENASPDSCGSLCDPCPNIQGGTPTCDGVRCGVSCPAGNVPCLDACLPMGSACDGTCPAGKNLCGGICVDSRSLTACGRSCTQCPTSPVGQASCDGETCALVCNTGFHKCGDSCVSDGDWQQCGASCTRCEAPAGGEAVCVDGRCDFICPGMTQCGRQCIRNDQPCNDVCPTGLFSCNGRCIPKTPGSCCTDAECGLCQKCLDNQCAAQRADEDLKNECGTGACKTGTCDGSGRCGGTANGQNDASCSGSCRECRNAECVEKTGTCAPRRCESAGFTEGRCSAGECRSMVVDACSGNGCSGDRCNECRAGARECISQQAARSCNGGRWESISCGSRGCVGGSCCPTGQFACNGTCLSSDQPCNGDCRGLKLCDGRCVQGNCCSDGECGDFRCSSNRCLTSCSNDADCRTGLTCRSSRCESLGQNGATCSSNAECQSNVCTSCFPDQDGDGHGQASASASRFCGFCRQGFTTVNDDCFDGNTSAQPGIESFFEEDRGDGSFDYNCDGREERLGDTVLVVTKCYPDGAYETMRIPSPECGRTWQANECVPPGTLVPKTNTVVCR
jgi:hypothetical protein